MRNHHWPARATTQREKEGKREERRRGEWKPGNYSGEAWKHQLWSDQEQHQNLATNGPMGFKHIARLLS